jgi:hypothetical protein
MSIAIRAEIAAAANAVAAVTAYPNFRQTTRPGDAMVRLDRVEYPDRFGGLGTWQLVVILNQDVAAAELWLDENRDALVTALSEVMSVRRAFPAELALDSGKVPALFIEGTRED